MPLHDDVPFFSVLHSIATTDAILYSARDNDASDPLSVTEAKRSKYWTEWLSTIHEELESLKAKRVYEDVHTLPPGRKAVQHKWVLHIKRDKDGTVSRFKAQHHESCADSAEFRQVPHRS